MCLNQPRFLISTQKDGKLAANYNYNHYNLPFSHIMIIVIISDEDMLNFYTWLFPCKLSKQFCIWVKVPWGSSFFNNLKRKIFVSMFSLKIWPELHCQRTFCLKLESYRLQHCKHNYHVLHFLTIFRAAASKNHAWAAEVALVNNWN